MFKQLLIISVVALLLAGCGESKQVTENMLIGSWKCEHVTSYDIENTSKDNRNEVIRNISEKYEKNNNEMTRQSYTLEPEDFTFIRLDDRPYRNVDSTTEHKDTYEYIYVSDDEFKHVVTSLFRNRQTKEHEELNIFTTTCIRQK